MLTYDLNFIVRQLPQSQGPIYLIALEIDLEILSNHIRILKVFIYI